MSYYYHNQWRHRKNGSITRKADHSSSNTNHLKKCRFTEKLKVLESLELTVKNRIEFICDSRLNERESSIWKQMILAMKSGSHEWKVRKEFDRYKLLQLAQQLTIWYWSINRRSIYVSQMNQLMLSFSGQN